MMDNIWNPWHGCHKYSAGCAHCYVYRRDESVGRDASQVTRTASFDLPLRRDRRGEYKLAPGRLIYACMTSDFFVEDADPWREEIWDIIRTRRDLRFMIITKRILRCADCLPPDWGAGWPHVSICCTMENQQACDSRFPVFLDLPIAHKFLACEPLLGPIDMRPWLSPAITRLVAGGESGLNARPCRYEWILDLRAQCQAAGCGFYFKQTGANFVKDGRLYRVPRKLQHSQARKAGINWNPR